MNFEFFGGYIMIALSVKDIAKSFAADAVLSGV